MEQASVACDCAKYAFKHVKEPSCPYPKPGGGDISKILQERGSRYGPFTIHAEISQDIKRAIFGKRPFLEYLGNNLSADKIEALEMIAHKIARIINGDPEYADSWDDIAGYATLVANRLKEKEKEKVNGNLTKANG